MNSGELIKSSRKELKLTQNELAEKTGLSIRTIQRIESGEVSPSFHSQKKLNEVLNMNFSSNNAFQQNILDEEKNSSERIPRSGDQFAIIAFHLSGMLCLFLPSFVIWLFFKDRSTHINEHGPDVLNFQLLIFLSLLFFGIGFPFVLFFIMIWYASPIGLIPVIILAASIIPISIYATFKAIKNTLLFLNDQPIKYPKLIQFIKAS